MFRRVQLSRNSQRSRDGLALGCESKPAALPQAFRHHSRAEQSSRSPSSNKVVRRSATLIGIVVLSLPGCEGGGEATSVERNTATVAGTTGPPQQNVLAPEDRLLRWITSCEVRELLFTHQNVVYIRFRDGEGRRVRLGDEATMNKVFATASEQPCSDSKIIVAIE
jgi:hypothetical protein